MWHMTCETWHVTVGGSWTFSHNVSSLALTVWVWRSCKDISTRDAWLTHNNNDKHVCRTALATLGLFIIVLNIKNYQCCIIGIRLRYIFLRWWILPVNWSCIWKGLRSTKQPRLVSESWLKYILNFLYIFFSGVHHISCFGCVIIIVPNVAPFLPLPFRVLETRGLGRGDTAYPQA